MVQGWPVHGGAVGVGWVRRGKDDHVAAAAVEVALNLPKAVDHPWQGELRGPQSLDCIDPLAVA